MFLSLVFPDVLLFRLCLVSNLNFRFALFLCQSNKRDSCKCFMLEASVPFAQAVVVDLALAVFFKESINLVN